MDKPNPAGRRSSILKLPRQKYSDEEAEESTAIESTIARNKRRVSFASSNFVKPFVSDPDQNTIWDTTYEESVDHTNSTRSSQDIASVQSVNLTGSITKHSFDEGGDVEMMDIDEDTNATILDTTQHVDFTNMSLEEMEIVNLADKENIVPSKCHRGSTVDFIKNVDSLQGDTMRELTYKNSENVHVSTTGQGFEIPVDPQRKSLDILHHTTSIIKENIYQGPAESIKPPFVSLDVSNISTGRHQIAVTHQFSNERLSASSGQIHRSVATVETFGSSKVAETDQNQSASLLSSDSMSAMDLTCEDPDIELGKFVDDGSLRASLYLSSVQTNQTQKSPEQNLSSVELTCQIPNEQTKTLGNDLSSSAQIMDQTRKSIDGSARRSVDKDQSVLKETRTESVQLVEQALSSIESICQIPTQERKPFCSNLTSTEITIQRKSICNVSSSMEFTCQLPMDNRSTNKDQSQSENLQPLDLNFSSMEFTCQIPSEQRKSLNNDLSFVHIPNQTRKSTTQDLSSMEFTCQIPTDARRSINKDQSVIESRIESVQLAQKDLSSMEFTCQFPTEQRKSFDSNLSSSTEIKNQRKSIRKHSSSMEFTCQVPTDAGRSINKDQSLQESQSPKQPVDLDFSSMEFTCQIPPEQRKSLGNNLPSPSVQIPNQPRKSTAQDLSSMEFTCQIPTDAGRSINKDQSLQESQSPKQPVDLDFSSMEFTCQIPSEQRKSLGNNPSSPSVQIPNQPRKSTAQDLSSMEFTCQIPTATGRSINKDQSLQESQKAKQPADLDFSSMEFTCQIPFEQRKSLGKKLTSPSVQIPNQTRKSTAQDLSSMEFTCQIPTDAGRSNNKDQSLQEPQRPKQPVDLDFSSMEFTCQIPSEQRKSLGNNLPSPSVQIPNQTRKSTAQDLSSMEFTCQIPTAAGRSINKDQSLQESQSPKQPVDLDFSSMEFTCQIPPEQRKSLGNNLPSPFVQIPNQPRKSTAQDLSSMEFTCQIPTDAGRSINKDQSLQESQSPKQPVDLDFSSMELTCQIPPEQRKSLGNNLQSPSVQIPNQTRKSTAQDLSSMVFTCQIPTDAGRSINKDQSLQESQSPKQPVDLDFSSMEFTGQIPSEQGKSLGNNLPSVQIPNQTRTPTQDLSSMESTCRIPTDARRSINKDQSIKESRTERVQPAYQELSSMEFTCQIPSHNKDHSLQESICQISTEDIKITDNDLSPMEFTCQIPIEQRKSVDKNPSSMQITSETRKSTAQNLSSMVSTCQVPTSCKKYDSFQESVCQLPSALVRQDLSYKDFIGQSPVEKRISTNKNQSTAVISDQNETASRTLAEKYLRISSQNSKSLDKDRSVLEVTRQTPSESTKPLDLDTSSIEFNDQLSIECNKPAEQDLSSMKLITYQIPVEKRKSVNKNQSTADFSGQNETASRTLAEKYLRISSQNSNSLDKDRSVLEVTRQTPSESTKPLDLDTSSIEFNDQLSIECNKPAEQDLSSMKLITCQIPVEKRKSVNKNQSTADFSGQNETASRTLAEKYLRISSQNSKSLDKDRSVLEVTRQTPSESTKPLDLDTSSIEFNDQLSIECNKPAEQDLSSMKLITCQIPVEKRKSVDKNQSTADFSGQNETASRTLAEKYLRISSQSRRSLGKDLSVLDVTCQTLNESTKPFDLDTSSIEFNDQLSTEYNKPADQDLSSMKLITSQIPVEKRTSIERNQSIEEFAGRNRTENDNKLVHKDLSCTDDSRRILSQSLKYPDKSRSIGQTCPISSGNTKSFDHSLSSDRQQVHQNEFLMTFTDQFPGDKGKSFDKNQSLEFTGQLFPSELRPSVGISLSSMESPLRNRLEDVKMEVDSPKQSTFAINVSSINFAPTDVPIETYRREKHDESMMETVSENILVIDEANPISKENVKSSNSYIRSTGKNSTVGLQNKTLNPHEKSDIADSSNYNMPSNVMEKTSVEGNKSRTFIDDLGGTTADLTHRRQHFTSLNPLERSVIAPVQFVDDETKDNLFLAASSQPTNTDDCKSEETKSTNILYSQTCSGPKTTAGKKSVSESKTPTTSFHMTLTPNLTLLENQICNLSDTKFVAQQSKKEMVFSMQLADISSLIDDFKCSLVDENDHLNSDTSETERDNKLMHVNDTYVLKTKSKVTDDTMNTELGNPDETSAQSHKRFAKDRSFAKTDQTFSKNNQTFAKSDQTYAKSDQTFVKNDQTYAKGDQSVAKADQPFAKADQSFAKADKSLAKADKSLAKADKSLAKADKSLAKADKTFAKDPADAELKTLGSCRELRNTKGTSSKNSEALKRCYNLRDNFKASINILQDGTKLDFNIVDNDDNDRMNRLLSMLENSPTRPATAHKKIEPKLYTFLNTKSTPDRSLRKIQYEQRLQINSYLENFKFKPFNLIEVETKSSASGDDTSDGTFENVTAEMSAELMSLSLNENTNKSVDFAKEISKLEKKASGFWNLEKVDGRKYYFSTLHGCLQFNVDFDQISGIVSNLDLKRNMPDSVHPYAHYVFHLLYERLANPSLSSAIGNNYDILSLLEYVHLISIKSLKFHQEYERMQGDGLVIQNMKATFTIIDLKLRIWWNITVDLKQGKLVDLDAKRGSDLLKSKAADIYNMVKICPKGFDFLCSFINSIKADLKI